MITTFSHVFKENSMEGMKKLKSLANKGSAYFGWQIREKK
jgi:hypothetical protein